MLRHSCVYLILLFLCGCVHQPTINKSTLVELKHIEELLPFRSCVYTIEPLYHFNWRNSKIVKTNDVNLAMIYRSVNLGVFYRYGGHTAIFVDPKGEIRIGIFDENGGACYYHGYEPSIGEVDWTHLSVAQATQHAYCQERLKVFPQGEFFRFSGVKFVKEGVDVFPAFYEVVLNYNMLISGEPFFACYEIILKDRPIEIIESQREDEWPFPVMEPQKFNGVD